MSGVLRRRLPWIAAAMALLIGAVMTGAVHQAENRRALAEFNRSADVAIELIMTRLREHLVLLRASKALFASENDEVDRAQFLIFLEEVGIRRELDGVQGIGMTRLLPPSETASAEAEIKLRYGLDVKVHPETDQNLRSIIVVLEPADAKNLIALGYDMYVDAVRRAAIERAIASGEPEMSGPVVLVQEVEGSKQTGFLILMAYADESAPGGVGQRRINSLVYAPFRGVDLVNAALEGAGDLPLTLTITDAEYPDQPIYSGDLTAADGELKVSQLVEVLGRKWQFDLYQTTPTTWQRHIGSGLVGLISLFFAGAIGFAVAARQRDAERAEEVAAAATREVEYRSLLLQEMKHRIKNHIARIQSIARQSARGATDVRAFTETFDARLQAMAAVQEILAGTAVPQAELTAILRNELQQVLDTDELAHLIEGPAVYLDARQAHAFALVAHELVTNALKYGGLSANGTGLKIRWSILKAEPGAAPRLLVEWNESFAAAGQGSAKNMSSTGFGSKLIDVSLKGELQGKIDRHLSDEGLQIKLCFPLNPAIRQNR